jgi:hypothetical protein
MASSGEVEQLPASDGPAALVQAGLAAIAAGEAALGAELMDRARVSTRRRLAEQAAEYARHARREWFCRPRCGRRSHLSSVERGDHSVRIRHNASKYTRRKKILLCQCLLLQSYNIRLRNVTQ